VQPAEQQSVGYFRFNVWATTLASAATGLIIVILSLPFHRMHPRMGLAGPRIGIVAPGVGVVPPHPAPLGGGPVVGWIFIGLLAVIVYAGIAGAIFAAIYNAIVSRR
jgi:hypothetical protein